MRLALPAISCKVNTPMDLAKAIVHAVGDEATFSWLEPSHGTGPFLEAISQLGVEKHRLFALDLDPRPSAADNLATTTRGVDFLRWARETELRFDRIVGNPPFISIKRLPTSLQRTAASVVDVGGQPIGRAANVWYAFVLASLGLLKDGGCIAFVLPSAAEFADYSAAIRHVVQHTFSSLELYRCARPLFEDVQEGTLVTVARGYGKQPCMVRHRRFQSRESLIQGLAQSGRLNGRRCRAQTLPCVWLFRPTERLTEHPNVSEYLNLGASEGGCDREAYKISMRKPWYRTPLPNAPHAFLSGMSQTGPWLCINEMIGLNATNTLDVVTFRSRNREVWYMWALALLSSVAQQQIRRIGRRYADGLVKYEPGPLGQIALPELSGDVDHRSLYKRAVDAVLSADPLGSREIADSARL